MFNLLLVVISVSLAASEQQMWELVGEGNTEDEPEAIITTQMKTFVSRHKSLVVYDHQHGNTTVIPVSATKQDLRDCLYSKTSEFCENSGSYTMLELYNNKTVLMCGKAALFKEKCYKVDIASLQLEPTLIEIKNIPDVAENMVSTLVDGKQLYIASCSSVGGNQCSLKRFLDSNPLSKEDSFYNQTVFVNMYSASGKTYTFFRDQSDMFTSDSFASDAVINTYGLVGRMCNNDKGSGSQTQLCNNCMMTYMQARLICPYPGSSATSSLYFDILQHVSIVDGFVFAVFTLPNNWSPTVSSALCVYHLQDIDDVIDGRAFTANQTKYYSKTEPDFTAEYVSKDDILPGQCPERSTTSLSENYKNFVTTNYMIKKMIFPLGGKAIHIIPGVNMKSIVSSVVTKQQYMLHLISHDGFVLRVLYNAITLQTRTLEERSFPASHHVKLFSHSATDGKLIIVDSDGNIYSSSSYDCSSHTSCSTCTSDPMCDWVHSPDDMPCVSSSSSSRNTCAETSIENLTYLPTNEGVRFHWNSQGKEQSYSVQVEDNTLRSIVFSKIVNDTSVVVSAQQSGVYTVTVWSVSSKPSSLEFVVPVVTPIIYYIDIQSSSVTIYWSSSAYSFDHVVITSETGALHHHYVIMEESSSNKSVQFNSVPIGRYNCTLWSVSSNIESGVVFQVFNVSASNKPTAEFAGVTISCNNLLTMVAVLAALLVVSLVIVLQNHLMIGFNSNILIPQQQARLTRCYFLLWSHQHNDEYESGSTATAIDQCDDTKI